MWGVSVGSSRSQKIELCVIDMLVQKQCETVRSAELDQLVRFMIRVGFTHAHGVRASSAHDWRQKPPTSPQMMIT